MGPPGGIDREHTAPRADALPLSYIQLPKRVSELLRYILVSDADITDNKNVLSKEMFYLTMHSTIFSTLM